MATTAKGLRYPGLTDTPHGPDQIENLASDVDVKLGYFVCTSGTRPGSPFQGQQIYETDTKATGFWDGSAWVMSDPGLAQVTATGALTGTYTGQPIKIITKAANFNTDANGDTVLIAAAEFSGGGILVANAWGSSTFDVSVAVRMLTGNVVGRVWNGGTLAVSTAVAMHVSAIGW